MSCGSQHPDSPCGRGDVALNTAALEADPTRRALIATGIAAVASILTGCDKKTFDEFTQHNFRELSKDDVKGIIARLEAEYSEHYGKPVHVGTEPALPGVVFGYALDLSRCVGCRKCVHACVKENNQSREPELQWIRVLQMDKEEGVNVQHADPYYNPKEVPEEGHFYMPVQCQQCRNPPCVKACPVGATWQEPDGITVIDYDWCIGCRYCEAACPYHARRFNWTKPQVPAEEITPVQAYLSNRIRPQGVMEKCTFCLHRTRNGKLPACLEACPTGARVFGNLLDPESEIRWILSHKRVFVLKEELGTKPSFFYFFDE